MTFTEDLRRDCCDRFERGDAVRSVATATYYEIDADTGEVTLTEVVLHLVNTNSGADVAWVHCDGGLLRTGGTYSSTATATVIQV